MRKRWRLPPVFGPLFGYDLVASTRRGQHTGLRILIAVALLITLFIVYAAEVRGFDPFANPFTSSARVDPKDMERFGEKFVTWCMIVQFAAVVLVTPIVVADAIAREKERRSLDFLFVTALTDREIILGKLGSRLAYLIGVLLTGLPILALTQLFGGVEPEMLLCSYAALIATLISLGSLSLYCSVLSSTALQATVRAYLAAGGYLMICPCLIYPLMNSDVKIPGMILFAIANLALAWVLVKVSIHDLRPRAELLPPLPEPAMRMPPQPKRRRPRPLVAAVADIVHAETDDDDLPFVLPVKTPVTDILSSPAEKVWDPVDWRQKDRAMIWEPPELPRPPLPPVDDNRPLLWKEVHLHSFTGGGAGGNSVIGVLLTLAAALAILIWLTFAFGSGGPAAEFSSSLVKVATLILGGLLGLGTIAHTVNSITRERERDTLDGLLTLPVTRDTVLAAKWLGGLVSLRLLILALLVVWVFGLSTGGLHPFALFALALAVAAVIEFLTSLGLWISLVCKTSLRANMAAVLCLLLVACGPLIVANYIEMLSPYSAQHHLAADAITDAVMPATAWWRLCIGWRQYAKLPEGYFPSILLGSLGYAVAAWLLWRASLARLRRYGGKRT